MKIARWLLIIFAILAACEHARAQGIHITIQPHVRRVVLGDPLFLEVTFLNKSEAAIAGPLPHPDLGTFEFRVSDPNSGSDERIALPVYGPPATAKSITFEPGKPVTFYWYAFLPPLGDFENRLWDPFRELTDISFTARYEQGDTSLGWTLKGEWVQVVARDYREVRAIDRLHRLRAAPDELGPAASDLGLPPMTRAQTAALASQVKTGELADLLLLVTRMQKIYDGPPAIRPAAERELAEWLARQPDVMRLALAQKLRAVARQHDMASTAKALEPLAEDQPPIQPR